MLSPFSVILAKTDIDLSGLTVMANGEYKEADLERAVNVAGRNKSAVQLYQKMFAGERAIAYCTSVAHADAVTALFNEQNITAATISGKTPIAEQLELKDRFHNGEIHVLCNADILIHGFDDPSASVCLNLRPTRSAVIAEQRAGRVLRLDPENPDKHATIVEFLDRNENKKTTPITFAQIVDGAYILPKTSGGGSGGGGGIDVVPKPEITIEGLQIITQVEEVMKIVREMIEQKAEPTQKGWYPINAIKKELKAGVNHIKKIAEEYRELHPDWFATLRSPNGLSYEHYASPLVELIAQEIKKKKTPIAPDGWSTANKLRKDLGGSAEYISKIVEEYRAEHPEWFEMYELSHQKIKRKYEHYAPGLVREIEQRFAQRKSTRAVPSGWMSVNELVKEYKKSSLTMKRITDEYRESHPEYFEQYRNQLNKVYEYYSPELVAEIKKRLGMEI